MKTTQSLLVHALAIGLAAINLAGASGARAASLTVTPDAITNDYHGPITLNITGLSNRWAVLVEKLVDFNSNGVVDTEDLVVRRFIVMDGWAPSIGGVRNRNVPGDDDGATNGPNGEIRVELFHPDLDEPLSRLAGSFLYRVFPLGTNSPLASAPFTVAQQSYPHGVGVSLTNVAAAGGQALSNVLVALADSRGLYTTAAFTDQDGQCTLYALPGDYRVTGVGSGYMGVGQVTIAAYQTTNLSLALTTADYTISGWGTVGCDNVRRDSGWQNWGNVVIDGVGGCLDEGTEDDFPALSVVAQTASHLMALGITDGNGQFESKLTPGPWRISLGVRSLIQSGFVPFAHDFLLNVSNNVTNLNFQVVRTSALIYGRVTDEQTNAVPGAHVWAEDSDGRFRVEALTCTNGDYSLGVRPGQWTVRAQAGEGLTNLVDRSTGGSVVSDEAVRVDFALRRATSRIVGQVVEVVDELSHPVGGLRLKVLNQDRYWPSLDVSWQHWGGVVNGGIHGCPDEPGDVDVYVTAVSQDHSFSIETDAEGRFTLGVPGGTWSIGLDSEDGQQRGFFGTNRVISAPHGTVVSNVIYSVQRTNAHLTGWVVDEDGHSIGGVAMEVWRLQTTNKWITTQADSQGRFDLALADGQWVLRIDSEDARQLALFPTNLMVSVSNGQTLLVTNWVRHASNRLAGEVKDGSNAPVSNLWISANDRWTQTDSNGGFTFQLVAGTWRLSLDPAQAAERKLFFTNQLVSLSGTDETNVNFSVRRTNCQLIGHVLDATNRPVPRMPLEITGSSEYGDHFRRVLTDTNGSYSVGLIGSNCAVASRQWPGQPSTLLFSNLTVALSDGETNNVTHLVRRPTRRITGHLTYNGWPVPEATLYAYSSSSGYSSRADVDAKGYFEIPVTEGEWLVGLKSVVNVYGWEAQCYRWSGGQLVNPSETNTAICFALGLPLQVRLAVLGFVPAQGLQLGLTGIPGLRHELQASTNLTDWSAIWTNHLPAGTETVFDTNATNFPHRFYRVVLQ